MSKRDSSRVQRPPRIFVCYRREEASGHAGRLSDILVNHFGRDNVFIDTDTIRPGQDYVAAIEGAVRNIDVLIAMIGPDWLSPVIPDQLGRRIDDPTDYVRLEIAEALRRKKTVIPALVRDALMPEAKELPEDIARLATRQAVELRDSRWFDDVQQLVDAIRPPTPVGVPADRETPTAAEGTTSEPRSGDGRRDRVHRMRTWVLAAFLVIALGAFALLINTDGNGGGEDNPSARPESTETEGTLVAELEAAPQDAVVEADGSIWVATIERDVGPALVHLDGSTLSEDARRPFDGLPVQVSAHDGVVWVLTKEGILLRFDPGSSEPTRLGLGGQTERAFVTSESLWVLLPNKDAVVRVDFARSDRIGNRLPVGDQPNLVAFADGRLWIANAGDATITPIEPPDDVLDRIELPDVAVAMINFKNEPLVATADGQLLLVRMSASGWSAEEVARIQEPPPLQLRLVPAGDRVWMWQQGAPFLWAFNPQASGSPVRYDAPFPLEKLAMLDESLWAVSRDGAVVKLSTVDASLEDDFGTIGERPSLLLKDEERLRLLVFTEDGSVYRLAT